MRQPSSMEDSLVTEETPLTSGLWQQHQSLEEVPYVSPTANGNEILIIQQAWAQFNPFAVPGRKLNSTSSHLPPSQFTASLPNFDPSVAASAISAAAAGGGGGIGVSASASAAAAAHRLANGRIGFRAQSLEEGGSGVEGTYDLTACLSSLLVVYAYILFRRLTCSTIDRQRAEEITLAPCQL